MRNPAGVPTRSRTRAARAVLVLATALAAQLTLAPGAAFAAADPAPNSEPNSVTFGVLGPVGVIAVVLGIAGMTAGVVRQRRRARAEAERAAVLADEPTRVLARVESTSR